MSTSSASGMTPPFGSSKSVEQMLYLEIQRRSPEFPGEILAYAKEQRRDLRQLLHSKEALLDFINEVLVKRTEQSWGMPPSESVETCSSSQGSIYEAPMLPATPQVQQAPQYYYSTPTHHRYVYVQRPQSLVYYYYPPVQPVKVVTPSVFYM